MADPYNPLNKMNLGRSVAEALLIRPVAPLTETDELVGAGVYAIYYTGAFEAYRPLVERNLNGDFEQPIYVGKSVPKGARKGGLAFDASKGRGIARQTTATRGLDRRSRESRSRRFSLSLSCRR